MSVYLHFASSHLNYRYNSVTMVSRSATTRGLYFVSVANARISCETNRSTAADTMGRHDVRNGRGAIIRIF